MPARMSDLTRARLKFGAAVAAFVALVGVSSLAGTPEDQRGVEMLPGVALGWPLLFHLERASAIAGVVGTTLLVAWRGANGQWPIRLGNVEYAPKEAVDVTAGVVTAMNDVLTAHDQRLRTLERWLTEDAENEGGGAR